MSHCVLLFHNHSLTTCYDALRYEHRIHIDVEGRKSSTVPVAVYASEATTERYPLP